MRATVRVLLCAVPVLMAGAVLAAPPPDPSNEAELTFSTGLSHMREGRTAQAIEQFKKATRQDPKNPYFHKGLGLALAELHKYDEAIAELRKAIELNMYYVDVRNDLGSVLVLSGRRDEGKTELLAAFNEPTNPTPELSARNLGQAYFEEKNYAQALTWFQTSLQRNKKCPDAYLGIADVLLQQGKLDDAIAQLEAGVNAVPQHRALLLSLGEAYYRAGRFTEARGRLEEVIKKDPLDPVGKHAAEMLSKFSK